MQPTSIRPFIPSKNYDESKAFYQALGFTMDYASDDLSIFHSGLCTFFLQRCNNEEFAKNLMLQLIVPNIDAAFSVISGIEGINFRFEPIKKERWGKVVYLWGPAGELWHVTELVHN
jgi:catechol 2,3-dioxygenase-like lactoylglutathione lyase family enzyme